MENKKGIFISFEGSDGSGKSTISKMLFDYMKNKGIDCFLTREPGGNQSEIAESIRDILLNKNDLNINYYTEALLFAASRAEHVNNTIIPKLKNDIVVICDRFLDSSLAYQGIGRDLGIDKVYQMNLFATQGLLPDITILIMVKPEIGLERIKQFRSNEINRLDIEGMKLQSVVYNGYIDISKRFPERIIVIDGNLDIETVFKNIVIAINKKIKEMKSFINEI